MANDCTQCEADRAAGRITVHHYTPCEMTQNEQKHGRLWNGFDYVHRAWVLNGKYRRCGHPGNTCGCFGRLYEGRSTLRTESE